MDTLLYLVWLWTELPWNYTLKSIIYEEYIVVEIPSTFLTDSTKLHFDSSVIDKLFSIFYF